MYTFKLGTVDVQPSITQRFGGRPFKLVFEPDNNNGWGITLELTTEEAKAMTREKAEVFYSVAIECLGISKY